MDEAQVSKVRGAYEELVKLGETMQVASKCGLGQSSPNAFLSIVENFRDELMGRTVAE